MRGPSDRARAAFLGEPLSVNAKNDVFFAREKCEKKFRARSAAMTGAPRGAHFRNTDRQGRVLGRVSGPFWGPGRAVSLPQIRKVTIFDDF